MTLKVVIYLGNETEKDRVEHAKAYPFPSPGHGFVYEAGDWRALDGPVGRNGRHPVLAAGSNQSPEQLRRKYGAMPDIGAVPAERGRLCDFDVVYAAHLTAYGSVPATFQHSPGTEVTVFLLWLTDRQLDRMHQTEGNYTYDHLANLRLVLDGGEELDAAFMYSSKVGCVSHRGSCVGLAEIAARDRVFPELSQVAALELVRDRLGRGTPLDDFIAEHLADSATRRERSARLGEGAIPAAYPRRIMLEL